MNAGAQLWAVTPKFHFLWHIAWFARFNSPRASWCYAFEDFVGKIQGSGMSCTVGTPMHNIPAKVFDNYMMALSLQLESFFCGIGE